MAFPPGHGEGLAVRLQGQHTMNVPSPCQDTIMSPARLFPD